MLIPLIRFFINPFNIFWILLGITIILWFRNKIKPFKIFTFSTIGWFLLISTPLLPTKVLHSLEKRYEPLYVEELANPDDEYHIVVLGGGHGFDDRLPANSLLSDNARARLLEGVRLHQQLPNSKLILSGYSSSGGTTQAEMLQKAALLLGVEKEATILQKEPSNTYEEAETYTQNFGNSNNHKAIVVTSAAHMSRAAMVFREFGTEPIPSPTNYRLKGSWKYKWIGWPSINNIENLEVGMSEYAAIVWYSLKTSS